ncbi:MAG: BrnA antitoxin family protein [Geminicoccaceae bacterium]
MNDRERELAALAALPDDSIDTSDLPESDDWGSAERGRFWRPVKRSVTIRLDADVIDWFRRREPKYQTAINRVLRQHMEGKGGPGTAGG